MPHENFNDLIAFLSVAREGSFTRAAAQLGVSQSALSHTIRGLETRLGVRLLTRTTRSVSLTEAGERLANSIGPHFEEIEAGLAALSDMREKPAGTIRITTSEHPANTVLWPAIERFLPQYPDIKIELVTDYGLTDIVADRFDAGVRLGDQVAKDMIAVRISPDQRISVVGSPAYFAQRAAPTTPHELTSHRCINLRLPTYGGLLVWDFEKDGERVNVRTDGQLIFNSGTAILRAALAGFGLVFLPEDVCRPYIEAGQLVRVLDDWCQPYAGYHLYYPSRRQHSPAFSLFVEALRYKPAKT